MLKTSVNRNLASYTSFDKTVYYIPIVCSFDNGYAVRFHNEIFLSVLTFERFFELPTLCLL
jgi:hypothetical protein